MNGIGLILGVGGLILGIRILRSAYLGFQGNEEHSFGGRREIQVGTWFYDILFTLAGLSFLLFGLGVFGS